MGPSYAHASIVSCTLLFFNFYFPGGVPIQYCEQPTNGMVYFRAMCNLNTLSEDLKIYVPLFCNVITKWDLK